MKQCEASETHDTYLSLDEFKAFWTRQNELAGAGRKVERREIDFHNPMARYFQLTFPGTDGTTLQARYICPVSGRRVPVVLMFHDYGRGVRGWHHMTRFIALGYAVAALENRAAVMDVSDGWRDAPEGLSAAQFYADALTAAHAVSSLPEADPARLVTWGEGLGGALALAAAAMVPGVVKCAALNPLPVDFPTVEASGCSEGFYWGLKRHFRWDDPQHMQAAAFFRAMGYLDCSGFAALLKCPALIGTGLMDTASPAAAQAAVVSRISSEKIHLVYPKYGHERINFYEDELVKFFHL